MVLQTGIPAEAPIPARAARTEAGINGRAGQVRDDLCRLNVHKRCSVYLYVDTAQA